MKPEVVERYAPVVFAVNERITEFNRFLAPECAFPLISANNSATYSDAMENEWGLQDWPSKELPGVYMFCCRLEGEEDGLALYIGKASMREMGFRMYHHLHPHRANKVYRRHFRGKDFVVEAMLATPVAVNGAGCLGKV